MDCDLSNEGLESHHMVLVMVVLQACTHLRRLHLDGNKVRAHGLCLCAPVQDVERRRCCD